jgi:hypothetical protein
MNDVGPGRKCTVGSMWRGHIARPGGRPGWWSVNGFAVLYKTIAAALICLRLMNTTSKLLVRLTSVLCSLVAKSSVPEKDNKRHCVQTPVSAEASNIANDGSWDGLRHTESKRLDLPHRHVRGRPRPRQLSAAHIGWVRPCTMLLFRLRNETMQKHASRHTFSANCSSCCPLTAAVWCVVNIL